MKTRADAHVAVLTEDMTIRDRSPQDELDELNARIDQASLIRPEPHERHCLDCFCKGRDAAVRLIRHGAA